MENPRAIRIECDGAMEYDSVQTGGNGYIIIFPDFFGLEPIAKSIRNDKQGIHRLEMISIFEAMEELLAFGKRNPGIIQRAEAVEIYTDRISVTDENQTNPYRIKEWRKADWKNHEGKDIKNYDLLERIDKTRLKVMGAIMGRVSINWIPERKNKAADKLSKFGKITSVTGRRIIAEKRRSVAPRLFSGQEVKYSKLTHRDTLELRLYAHEYIRTQYEASFEVCSGILRGQVVKIYIDEEQKATIHKHHFYLIEVKEVFRNHITAIFLKEISHSR